MTGERRVPARLSALVVLAGAIAAGARRGRGRRRHRARPGVVVEAGVAMPAARPEPTLSSTWYCAGGTATENGFGDHILIVANPTDEERAVTITALTGQIAPAPPIRDAAASTTSTSTTSTTAAPAVTTPAEPPTADVEVEAHGRIAFFLRDLVEAPLAGAVVEVEGGEIAVEHEIRGPLGRATAPCATTASSTWSVPWGVTARGARELFVFMNPFPDNVSVDITFATDEGVRDVVRFQGFVVPGRSVVGAYIDEDVTRKEQVSAKVTVRGGGRVILDKIQTFSGVDGREGMTLGLGAPSAALTWMFPDGLVGEGLAEQIVVYNPTDRVAEIEVEVRPDDPEANGTPEPFELTVAPTRYAIVNLHEEDRVPSDVGHSSIVRSLNGVPVVAERAVAATEGAPRRGVGATLGAPFGSPVWYFPGGGTSDERDEFITLFNPSIEESVTYSLIGLANGQELAIQDLQDVELAPGRPGLDPGRRQGGAGGPAHRGHRQPGDRGGAGPLPGRRRRPVAGHGHPVRDRHLRPRPHRGLTSRSSPRGGPARPGGLAAPPS